MSTMEIRIPESIRGRLEHIARADGVSLDSFVASILLQRVAFADVDSYAKQRAARAKMEDFDKLLALVPDVEPDEHDRIPQE